MLGGAWPAPAGLSDHLQTSALLPRPAAGEEEEEEDGGGWTGLYPHLLWPLVAGGRR